MHDATCINVMKWTQTCQHLGDRKYATAKRCGTQCQRTPLAPNSVRVLIMSVVGYPRSLPQHHRVRTCGQNFCEGLT